MFLIFSLLFCLILHLDGFKTNNKRYSLRKKAKFYSILQLLNL